jgi:hypothetical protein
MDGPQTLLDVVQRTPAGPATRFGFVALGPEAPDGRAVWSGLRLAGAEDLRLLARALVDALYDLDPAAAALFAEAAADALTRYATSDPMPADIAERIALRWSAPESA